MKKHKTTWVLVADGTRARIFVKNFKSLNNAMGQDFVSDNLRDSEIYMDKPGRSFESSNPTRHAYQPRTDWHEYQKEIFAKYLCAILDKANEKADFDELIIVSPPKCWGIYVVSWRSLFWQKLQLKFQKILQNCRNMSC